LLGTLSDKPSALDGLEKDTILGSLDAPPRFDEVEDMTLDELTDDIKHFDKYVYGCSSIRDLVSTSTTIPLGFN
jgi:hypothetical protein